MDIFGQMNEFWSSTSTDITVSNMVDDDINENNITKCTSCGSGDIVKEVDDGTINCMNCGEIKKILLISSQCDKNLYGSGDNRSDPSHCGNNINPLLPKSSLGTIISGKGSNMLKKIHNWTSMPYKERSLWHVFEEIQNIFVQNDIPQSYADKTKEYVKMMSEKKISRGKLKEAMNAVCAYFAFKNKGLPRSDVEVSELFKVSVYDFNRAYKEFIFYMAEHLNKKDMKPIVPSDLIPRYAHKLGVPNKYADTMVKLALKVEKRKMFAENTPQSVVGGIIVYVCDLYEWTIDRVAVAEFCHISPMTLNKIYNKLKEKESELIKIRIEE